MFSGCFGAGGWDNFYRVHLFNGGIQRQPLVDNFRLKGSPLFCMVRLHRSCQNLKWAFDGLDASSCRIDGDRSPSPATQKSPKGISSKLQHCTEAMLFPYAIPSRGSACIGATAALHRVIPVPMDAVPHAANVWIELLVENVPVHDVETLPGPVAEHVRALFQAISGSEDQTRTRTLNINDK